VPEIATKMSVQTRRNQRLNYNKTVKLLFVFCLKTCTENNSRKLLDLIAFKLICVLQNMALVPCTVVNSLRCGATKQLTVLGFVSVVLKYLSTQRMLSLVLGHVRWDEP
jgi:hypothetical protein